MNDYILRLTTAEPPGNYFYTRSYSNYGLR